MRCKKCRKYQIAIICVLQALNAPKLVLGRVQELMIYSRLVRGTPFCIPFPISVDSYAHCPSKQNFWLRVWMQQQFFYTDWMPKQTASKHWMN